MIAIPADAKNVEAAHTFINYLMKPDVIANITNVVQFPNGNKGGHAAGGRGDRTDRVSTRRRIPSRRSTPSRICRAKVQRLMTRSWTKIKSGK